MSEVREQFVNLIQQHEGILWKILHLYVDDGETKQDLKQEILLQAWQSFERFEGKSQFSTWFYRVALNTVLAFNRKRKPTFQYAEKEMAQVRAEEADTAGHEVLWLAIKSLDDIDKTLITLHLEGYTHEEIADILGLTPNHIGVKLHRIKSSLRKKIRR